MAAKKAAKPAKKAAKKASPKKAAAKPAFGRAGTAGKADGAGAVRAWIESVKPEHRPMVEKLDALIGEAMPDAARAIKWSMPMYGLPGQGWIVHLASYKDHVSLGFFSGSKLTPPPPSGESETMRRANFPTGAKVDERQVRSWLKQAATLPGWGKV